MPLFFVLMALLGLTGGASALDFDSDPEALSGSLPARGEAIAEAWYILPTTRYDHFVHDNATEAGGVRVRLADGRVVSLVLPTTQVFEDSTVRLADLDGDGTEEVVAVLTSLHEGASLAVLGVDGDGLRIVAQTPFIGTSHRWLNPAQIADFDGDGRLEISLVQMPHLVKRLEIWRLEAGLLRRIAEVDDVSNHAFGTPQQSLSLATDVDGDGVADLIIPAGDRQSLRVLSFAGTVRELRRLPLAGTAVGDLSLEGRTISVRLEGGRKQSIALP